jgi:hypothetical protein
LKFQPTSDNNINGEEKLVEQHGLEKTGKIIVFIIEEF